tara:strand:+ start:224 stop:334 length:111 start_codon:yes stop_codon:yes gene_type:complete
MPIQKTNKESKAMLIGVEKISKLHTKQLVEFFLENK